MLHKLEIERVPRLLDRRVVVETCRRKFRRRCGDVGELRILDERVPLQEVLAERLDQDIVGAERRESLGQRRRQHNGLVVLATPAIADAAHNATASVRASARGRALGGPTIRAVVVGNSSSVSRIIVLLTMSGAACEMKLVLVAPPLAR